MYTHARTHARAQCLHGNDTILTRILFSRLYLRDSYGNYISCDHYYRDLKTRNISEISVYHETEGLSSWTTEATIGRCSDRVYKEAGGFSSKDGVLDVEFQLPSSLGEEAAGKEIVLDLEVRINGKRLKQGPYSTAIRPARLNPGICQVMGIGTKGAEPGQEQVLSMQLVNELGDNMTTCGSMALTVGLEKCGALLSKVERYPSSTCSLPPHLPFFTGKLLSRRHSVKQATHRLCQTTLCIILALV
jgi:hypothetical protein